MRLTVLAASAAVALALLASGPRGLPGAGEAPLVIPPAAGMPALAVDDGALEVEAPSPATLAEVAPAPLEAPGAPPLPLTPPPAALAESSPPLASPQPPLVAAPLPTATPATPPPPSALEDRCEPTAGRAPAGQPAAPAPAPGGFSSFSTPLPPTSLWNPPGPRRVGLQAGHWRNEERPAELGQLQHGASGGGKQEWEVNLDIARRTAALLEAAGVEVDVLPTTVPVRYRAHAFISIHADGDEAGRLRGFKIARPGFSSIPAVDDRLVDLLYAHYGPATGLPRDDDHITRRMLFYYAFNARRYCHAVAPGVPQAIVETAFLTNAQDRELLLRNPAAIARGIAGGILAFLETLPEPAAR